MLGEGLQDPSGNEGTGRGCIPREWRSPIIECSGGRYDQGLLWRKIKDAFDAPARTPHYLRGYGKLYLDTVTQAHEGCDFGFLHKNAG